MFRNPQTKEGPQKNRHNTVDERILHHLRDPGSDNSLLNSQPTMFFMVSKWCEMDFVTKSTTAAPCHLPAGTSKPWARRSEALPGTCCRRRSWCPP